MSNFDIRLVGPDDVDEGTPYEKVEAAKDIYGWPFERVRGMEKLINIFRKYLFTTYGSDETDPNYGCYLKKMIGQSFDSLEDVADGIQTEVKRAKDQLINNQTESLFSIPDDERLKEVILEEVYEDTSSSMWKVNARYTLINYEGEQYEGELLPAES
jgi:hypothetical protein